MLSKCNNMLHICIEKLLEKLMNILALITVSGCIVLNRKCAEGAKVNIYSN